MVGVYLQLVEHADGFGEQIPIQILAHPIYGDEIAGPIDYAVIQFRILEDDAAEQVHDDVVKRLLFGEKV